VSRYDRPHTLFSCDPFHWGKEGYGVGFGLGQYARMAELMRKIKGRMIVSVNEIAEMRKAFNGFEMRRLGIRYTWACRAAVVLNEGNS
jgi:DNA adenine methylase